MFQDAEGDFTDQWTTGEYRSFLTELGEVLCRLAVVMRLAMAFVWLMESM